MDESKIGEQKKIKAFVVCTKSYKYRHAHTPIFIIAIQFCSLFFPILCSIAIVSVVQAKLQHFWRVLYMRGEFIQIHRQQQWVSYILENWKLPELDFQLSLCLCGFSIVLGNIATVAAGWKLKSFADVGVSTVVLFFFFSLSCRFLLFTFSCHSLNGRSSIFGYLNSNKNY